MGRAFLRLRITRARIVTAINLASLVLLAGFAFQGRPPAGAQVAPLTIKDVQQDDAIMALQVEFVGAKTDAEHRASDDRDSRKRQWDAINAIHADFASVKADVAGIKGENRVEFGGLGALYGTGILIQRRRKKKSEGAEE